MSLEQDQLIDSRYNVLNSAKKEIRLCSITEHSSESHIDLTLRTIQLKGCTNRFNSLSYTWADSTLCSVTIDGARLLVGQNLFCQLQKLLDLGLGQDIWIDAICINQRDEDEIQSQMKLVPEIYSLASEVFVGLEGRLRRNNRLNEVFAAFLAGNGLDEVASTFNHPNEIKEARDDFMILLKSKWFTRLWILTEVCYARSVTVILPWVATVSWESFNELANWDHNQHELCSLFATPSRAENEEFYASMYQVYNCLNGLARTTQALPRGQHIIELMLRHPNMRAKDLQANIHAFQSLCIPGLALPHFPRESTDVEVFTGFAVWLITNLQSLLPLVLELPRETCNFPTWVPNFSSTSLQHENHHRMRLGFYEEYDASKGLGFEVEYHAPDKLRVSGIRIDHVSLVSEKQFNLDFLEDHHDVITGWHKFFDPQGDTSDYSPSSMFSDDEFYITMTAGYVFDGTNGRARPVEPEDFNIWKLMVLRLDQGNLSTDDQVFHSHFMDSHVAASFNRKLFWTANGRSGLGPAAIMQTDEIWILGGCKTPLALRETKSASGHTFYRVIGSCFINGCMFGEAVTKSYPLTACMLG